jgi:hypothetical protein
MKKLAIKISLIALVAIGLASCMSSSKTLPPPALDSDVTTAPVVS